MATTLYITRADINELSNEAITYDEFVNMVENDPSLVWAEESGFVEKEELQRIKPKSAAIWKEDGRGSLWFELENDGTMMFGYRERPTIDLYLEKIFEVAQKLNANVQDDEGNILFQKA